MAVTLTDLERRTLVNLGEAAASVAFDLSTGTDTFAVSGWATADNLLRAVNDARAELCRTCFPLHLSGTIATVSGQREYQYKDFTVTGGSLWAARDVTYDGNGLDFCEAEFLSFWPVSGVTYWSELGDGGLILTATPAAVKVLAVTSGLGIPTAYATGSDTSGWIADDEAWLLADGAAYCLAKTRLTEPLFAERFPALAAAWDAGRQKMWSRIPDALRLRHYPNPPASAPLGPATKGKD